MLPAPTCPFKLASFRERDTRPPIGHRSTLTRKPPPWDMSEWPVITPADRPARPRLTRTDCAAPKPIPARLRIKSATVEPRCSADTGAAGAYRRIALDRIGRRRLDGRQGRAIG